MRRTKNLKGTQQPSFLSKKGQTGPWNFFLTEVVEMVEVLLGMDKTKRKYVKLQKITTIHIAFLDNIEEVIKSWRRKHDAKTHMTLAL